MKIFYKSLLLAAVGILIQISSIGYASDKLDLVVFTAKKIITMEPSLPEATAVAVADGKIVSVGSLKSLKSWINSHNTTIDTTFQNQYLMPGFIDPHVHPSLPAVLTQFPFIAPDDWVCIAYG